MLICRVVGVAISTAKQEKLLGLKLLIVRQATPGGDASGDPFIAADTVGAGEGELVLVATGSAARETESTLGVPVDATIVAIVDSLAVGGRVTFQKEAVSTGSGVAAG
jgi:ethanolamine utilization protein EutN